MDSAISPKEDFQSINSGYDRFQLHLHAVLEPIFAHTKLYATGDTESPILIIPFAI